MPTSQHAVQLVGPGQLKVNPDKPVMQPGPRQILLKIEAVGLCFSDLKLLKQFSAHPRKAGIVSGIAPATLAEIPSYVPGETPVVPGHEAVGVIVAAGPGVERHKIGERVLVQTDYRDLKTPGSNAAFGYNFEGGLQEYVLLDERVVIDATGERFLIPAPQDLSASAIALVEPWACVENSYVNVERQAIKAGGRLLVVADAGHAIKGLDESFAPEGKPASLTAHVADPAQRRALEALGVAVTEAGDLAALPDQGFDDIVYFGADKATIELLNDKLAARGVINLVLGGATIGVPVTVGVGRIHYGMTRWIGTTGDDASESYKVIPATGELRPNDRVLVVGAGGPMGQMHVIRAAASGIGGLEVVSTDVDDARLASLADKAATPARQTNTKLVFSNPQKSKIGGVFSYVALMAPVGALVAQAIKDSDPLGCLINIFAGIPAPVKHELDLDTHVAHKCFMFGTSGSEIRDMKIVLGKVVAGRLDTNLSVDAVSGMAGALDGLAAVENRTLAGKILVYPMLHDLSLTPLATLGEKFPTVAAKLADGHWTGQAEAELLKVAGKKA
jgi:threonine dehydrogenase-like Zn-dependent dehydrogenase